MLGTGSSDGLKVAITVLAAGASTRMGNAKLLMPFCGTTLLEHACRTACGTHTGRVFVITGAYHLAMEPLISDMPISVVHNLEWETGQASSVSLAARTCEASGYDKMVIFAADQPFITSDELDGLIQESSRSDYDIIACALGKRVGNPCIFSKRCYEALMGLRGDEGARRILRCPGVYGLKVGTIEPGDAHIFEDIDTPDDFDRVERLMMEEAVADVSNS